MLNSAFLSLSLWYSGCSCTFSDSCRTCILQKTDPLTYMFCNTRIKFIWYSGCSCTFSDSCRTCILQKAVPLTYIFCNTRIKFIWYSDCSCTFSDSCRTCISRKNVPLTYIFLIQGKIYLVLGLLLHLLRPAYHNRLSH
jgi:hypothetical protein